MGNSKLSRYMASVVCSVFMLMAATAGAQTVTVPVTLVGYPDLVIHNAKIATMDDASLNPTMGRTAEAMAVRDGKILALGSNSEMLALAGSQTRKIDLRGRTVIPGIINTHSHMHDHSVQRWVQANEDKIESVVRRFSVSGENYEELARGIELVIKEQLTHAEPDQWAIISPPPRGQLWNRDWRPVPE